MNLGQQPVQFHLSPEGRRALRGLVPNSGSFQAVVVGQEDLGLLIWRPLGRLRRLPQRVPVMLLRWDYIATMTFHLGGVEEATREPIGFSPA